MQFFIYLMLFWWLMFMPMVALCLFGDAIQAWIMAKADEIHGRIEKRRPENHDESKYFGEVNT